MSECARCGLPEKRFNTITEKLWWNNHIECSIWELIKWNVGAIFLLIGLVMCE